jgi:Trk K+ transport system NAD-binding subunit
MALHILHPEIGNWWYTHLNDGVKRSGKFAQVALNDKSEWVGKSILNIHATDSTMIIAVKREGAFISPPAHDMTLQQADIAIAIGDFA